jgi:hypothetical protein
LLSNNFFKAAIGCSVLQMDAQVFNALACHSRGTDVMVQCHVCDDAGIMAIGSYSLLAGIALKAGQQIGQGSRQR